MNTAQPGHDARRDEPDDGFEAEPIEIASGAMISDLVRLFRDEMRMLPEPWHRMSEDQQKAALERADFRCAEAVRQAILHIAGAKLRRARALLSSVTFDTFTLKAALQINLGDLRPEELACAVGRDVVLVLASAAQFDDGTRPTPEPEQTSTPLAPEDNPENAT
jgi:hypothetical protein